MFVVTQEGYKLPVDDSSIPGEGYVKFQQQVGLYTDDTILKPIWILELDKKKDPFGFGKNYELEFVCEIRFEHKPTEEEILFAMSQNGCSRWDVAFVHQGYELDIQNSELERVAVE